MVSGQSAPGKTILASSNRHYTHERISKVLQLPFEIIASDGRGRIDLKLLEKRLTHSDVGTLVVTMGTTAIGSVDPLHEILVLRTKYNFRIHADAAYGGYFTLLENLEPDTQKAFAAMRAADSIAIDPHKHGLQPYGCGCILFKDPQPAAGTNTILLIPISLRMTCISARSVWSAPVPVRSLRLCGPRKSSYR